MPRSSDRQLTNFDVSLYLDRITFDQLQKSPSQDDAEAIHFWHIFESSESFNLRATLHNLSILSSETEEPGELFLHDAELSELQRKKPLREKMKHLIVHRRGDVMTKDEFENEADRLYKCCLRSCTDMHELHIRRLIGMEILADMMQRVNITYINLVNIMHIIWSIMSCMHHFQLRLKLNTYKIIQKSRRKKLHRCMTIYCQLTEKLNDFSLRLALNAVMTFYKEGKLWDVDFDCMQLISRLLAKFTNPEIGFHDIIRN
ncbi:unnamed protein product [Acanthoscelides obtectus]|uniref:Uncharacterized protein n=1 Tax=Acanthoscelides obtectus TaxID=200917 RepID=A0A9P0L2K2_ACAOB|nr:unnamed protein product [Acanthoscelides obtectus]CAK1626450.1 hypothetical protein AOBTE_LOCUS3852 [Acanthoscelides obtectus]